MINKISIANSNAGFRSSYNDVKPENKKILNEKIKF